MTPSGLLALSRTAGGKKMVRYTATSLICVVISTLILTTLGILKWDAGWAAVTACAISTVPSYVLNRKWAWGRAGRGHFLKEITPFWVMAFIGLVFSSWAALLAQGFAKHHHYVKGGLTYSVLVDGAFIGAFGVLWLGKFLIINKVLFAPTEPELTEAVEGPSGLAH
jgi:putative flippase GtrA